MWTDWLNAVAGLSPVPELLVKVTVLLTLTWLLWPLVSRLNLRWQVFYWRGAATAALLLPLVVLLGPTIPVPLLVADPVEPGARVPQASRSADEWRDSPPWSDTDVAIVPPENAASASVSTPTATQPVSVADTGSKTSRANLWSWNSILIVTWLVPVLLLLVGAAAGEWRTACLVRQARAAPAVAAELLAHVARDLDFRRHVRVCVSPFVDSPRVIGIWRSVIVLPDLTDAHDTTDLRGVFAHEISHVKSNDLAWLRVFQLVSIGLWFHPLVWGLRRQHSHACERACDVAAAVYVGDASTYAATLARIALGVIGSRRALAGIAITRKQRIHDRLLRLQNVVSAAPLRRRQVLPVLVIGLILLTAMGALQLVEARSPAFLPDASAAEPEAGTEQIVNGDTAKAEPASTNAGAKFDCKLIDIVSHAPVADGTVTLQLRISGGGKAFDEWPLVRRTEYTTGANGEFTLEILPEEQNRKNLYVEIEADHPDYVHSYGGYSYSMIKKNLKMGAAPWFKTLGIFPAARLTGTVVTPDGKPASGVYLSGATRLDLDSYQTSGHYFKGRTDEEGRFEVKIIRGGEAILWITPKDYSPSLHVAEHRLSEMSDLAMKFFHLDKLAPEALTDAAKTRELGQIVLEEGIRIQGRVVDVDGAAVEGVWVNARLFKGPAKKNYDKYWANIDRSALTDADGRFEMGPLPPGTYRVSPSEEPEEEDVADRSRRPVPAVFFAREVTLQEGTKTATVDFQAVPHATIVAQYYNSAGEPRSGSDVGFFGRHDDGYFSERKEPSAEGRVEFRVPRGLEHASLSLITNEHSSLRHRVSKDGPLRNGDRVELGTISGDMKDIAIVRYVAPILLIQAVDEDGTPIKNFEAMLYYEPGRSPLQGGGEYLRNGRPVGHVSMYEQSDGRWRTSQLLPDEEFKLTVKADGYEPKSQTLSMPEGETREIEVTLKKTAIPTPRSTN